jgi:hypothetical protein
MPNADDIIGSTRVRETSVVAVTSLPEMVLASGGDRSGRDRRRAREEPYRNQPWSRHTPGVAGDEGLGGGCGSSVRRVGLAATSLGQTVGFVQWALAEIGHGAEIEIEQSPGRQLSAAGEWTRDLLLGDTGGVFRQNLLIACGASWALLAPRWRCRSEERQQFAAAKGVA